MLKQEEIEKNIEDGDWMEVAIKIIIALFILGILAFTISWDMGCR